MLSKNKALFIGNFLSKTNGSLSVSEQVAEKLMGLEMTIHISSRQESKILRLTEMVFNIVTTKSSLIHIDVYSGQAFRIAEIATFISAIRKRTIILTLHGGALPEFHQKYAYRISKVLNRAEVIQTPSLYLKAYFEQAGFVVKYLPNAIDLTKFPYDRSSVIPFSLLWVRAFTPIYQPDIAVKLFYEVRKKYPLATLTMIGPDKGNLEDTLKLIDLLSLRESITITGPIPNEQLYQYYNIHEVYLNTTIYESFGVAIVEAAACGIPIVSTNVGEIPYLWTHEKNILLVNDFEPTSFAEQVFRVFEDKELAKRLSINANLKAQSFDWEQIKPHWIKLLTQ